MRQCSGSRERIMAGLLATATLAGAPASAWAVQQEGAAAVVTGMVFDSTEMTALSGARVAVLGTSAVGEADKTGRFRLDAVPPGSWWLSFFHPRLQALGVSAPSKQIVVRESGVVAADLAIPSEQTLLMGWCMAEQPGPGFAALAGVVADSITGVPMPRAIVRAQVADRSGAKMDPTNDRAVGSAHVLVARGAPVHAPGSLRDEQWPHAGDPYAGARSPDREPRPVDVR